MLLILLVALSTSVPVTATKADPCDLSARSSGSNTANNGEMTALFEADQSDRDDAKTIDWAKVRPRDQARRLRTSVLIAAKRLQTPDDFYHAAFVYQHGDTPEEILTAHALAVAAVARGKSGASWIAAASLDRYLQRIGKPQIYGTQFMKIGKEWTQEPYDREVVSDGLRQLSCVPTLAEQKLQLKEWQKDLP